MIEKKTVTPAVQKTYDTVVPNRNYNSPAQTPAPADNNFFSKENYTWMLAGLVIIAIGMLLMSGGKSANANTFDQKEVYSTTRITIAPLLIVIGLALEVVGIFKKQKSV